MADQLGALSLLDEPAAPASPQLIVQIERNDDAKPARDLQQLCQRLPTASCGREGGAVLERDPALLRDGALPVRRDAEMAGTRVRDRQHAVSFRKPRRASARRCPSRTARFATGRHRHHPALAGREEPRRAAPPVQQDGGGVRGARILVLRFDFYGLGDSEGEIREPMLADLYGSIQMGRYVKDTRCCGGLDAAAVSRHARRARGTLWRRDHGRAGGRRSGTLLPASSGSACR